MSHVILVDDGGCRVEVEWLADDGVLALQVIEGHEVARVALDPAQFQALTAFGAFYIFPPVAEQSEH